MYTMSAFDPTLILLVNIYADEFSSRQDTRVYANAAMQVSLFVSVNYNGDTDEGILDQIKGYVQDNVVIYSLDNGMSPLSSEWVKSTTSNEFLHDLDHSSSGKSGSRITSDIRVPLYFTIPFNSEGEHRWIAKLGDSQTNSNTPVIVNVEGFSIAASHFTIESVDNVGECQLRTLRYKSVDLPDSQKLVKCLNYKGMKFVSTGGNAWLSMVRSTSDHKAGFFLVYKNTKADAASSCHEYYGNDIEKCEFSGKDNYKTSCTAWDDPEGISSSSIDTAWGAGIAMIKIGSKSLGLYENSYSSVWNHINFEMNNFQLQDNFGNKVEIVMSWNCGDWHGCWEVSSVKVLYS